MHPACITLNVPPINLPHSPKKPPLPFLESGGSIFHMIKRFLCTLIDDTIQRLQSTRFTAVFPTLLLITPSLSITTCRHVLQMIPRKPDPSRPTDLKRNVLHAPPLKNGAQTL